MFSWVASPVLALMGCRHAMLTRMMTNAPGSCCCRCCCCCYIIFLVAVVVVVVLLLLLLLLWCCFYNIVVKLLLYYCYIILEMLCSCSYIVAILLLHCCYIVVVISIVRGLGMGYSSAGARNRLSAHRGGPLHWASEQGQSSTDCLWTCMCFTRT